MSTARDYRAAVERGPDLAEPESQRFDRSPASGLERRLTQLPDGHPSAARYADGRNRPEEARPLTDAEHAEHIKAVEAKLDEARTDGLATDVQHTIDPRRVLWSREREALHDSVVLSAYSAATAVPCEGRAIIAGGLPGAGKSTVLAAQAGIDRSRYLTINPDAIKEELAKRGMIPEVPGLSPMEASDLVHEESSHIAKRISQLAQADRRNVIWDVTMSSVPSTERRIDLLRSAGYAEVEGIFVDVALDVCAERALARHKEGNDAYRSGEGLGGRHVSADVIQRQADPEWGSMNRGAFEQLKTRFNGWALFDNSAAGKAAILVDSKEWRRDDREGQHRGHE